MRPWILSVMDVTMPRDRKGVAIEGAITRAPGLKPEKVWMIGLTRTSVTLVVPWAVVSVGLPLERPSIRFNDRPALGAAGLRLGFGPFSFTRRVAKGGQSRG